MKRLFALLALAVSATPAYAGLIFSDTANNNLTFRGVGDSPLSHMTVSAPTAFNRISVLVDLNASGNMKFVVFDGSTLISVTTAKAFADDGLTFKQSDIFSPVTLLPGHDYYIGAIADVGGSWAYLFPPSPVTQNGITNQGNNGNVFNFNSPTFGGTAFAQIPIQLFLDAVPEPATFAVFGVLAVGAFGLRRRLKAAAAA
jgi:PEP-CTERM motif